LKLPGNPVLTDRGSPSWRRSLAVENQNKLPTLVICMDTKSTSSLYAATRNSNKV